MTEHAETTEDVRERLLTAALAHVPFDGWSEASLRAAITETGIEPALARAVFPRGPVEMARAYSRRGDRMMAERLQAEDLSAMRMRERIAYAVRVRLEVVEREAVRRATTLFALPQNAGEGPRAVWETADRIWTELGDTSTDASWYTKRVSLSGVISATVLYWLGDETPGRTATWGFLDRRIAGVMRFEKVKGRLQDSPLGRMASRLPGGLGRRRRRTADEAAAGAGPERCTADDATPGTGPEG